ncbi:MAG: GIY-YIG nuclease family protein [Candidatus Berkelbacteria bacterium]|nr:GIY-YIG nuclease family protein [Candidatus Berkelbacteria bacterium]
MFYVYILFSKKDSELYTGITDNLKNRIERHQRGLVKATRYRLPLKLIYYESYLEKPDAKRREKYLKGGKGRGELKIQLHNCLEKMDYKHL